MPYRRVTVRTVLGEVKTTTRMAQADHAYERKGTQVLGASVRARADALAHGVAMGSVALPEVTSHCFKLHPPGTELSETLACMVRSAQGLAVEAETAPGPMPSRTAASPQGILALPRP